METEIIILSIIVAALTVAFIYYIIDLYSRVGDNQREYLSAIQDWATRVDALDELNLDRKEEILETDRELNSRISHLRIDIDQIKKQIGKQSNGDFYAIHFNYPALKPANIEGKISDLYSEITLLKLYLKVEKKTTEKKVSLVKKKSK